MSTVAWPDPSRHPDLMALLDWMRHKLPHGKTLRRLTDDSRAIASGDVFFAYPGRSVDGRRYLKQAIEAGAAAVIYEQDADCASELQRIAPELPQYAFRGLRDCLGVIAAHFYEFPSDTLRVIAVTGTNGKTSCAHWIAQALAALGSPCGVIGTLGTSYYHGAEGARAPLMAAGDRPMLTTPTALELHYALAWLRDQEVGYAAIEASSIGLVQDRLQACRIDVAAWTNLSHDHLDYHESMAAYEAAKQLLFRWPGLRRAVVNRDDPAGQRVAAMLRSSSTQPEPVCLTVSANGDESAELRADGIRYGCDAADRSTFGMSLQLLYGDAAQRLCVPVLGRFNADNLLIVLGVLLTQGFDFETALTGMQAIVPLPGRMECVTVEPNAPLAIVDYAHTPDALAQVLQTLRQLAQSRGGRLICVFGCGGDRDPAKRPQMGRIAEEGADEVWLTSDNPRSEPAAEIVAQILRGLRHPDAAFVELDRALAIAHALNVAEPRDVVLLAGKGHERYQDIAGKRYEFSDSAHALAALRSRVMLPRMARAWAWNALPRSAFQ